MFYKTAHDLPQPPAPFPHCLHSLILRPHLFCPHHDALLTILQTPSGTRGIRAFALTLPSPWHAFPKHLAPPSQENFSLTSYLKLRSWLKLLDPLLLQFRHEYSPKVPHIQRWGFGRGLDHGALFSSVRGSLLVTRWDWSGEAGHWGVTWKGISLPSFSFSLCFFSCCQRLSNFFSAISIYYPVSDLEPADHALKLWYQLPLRGGYQVSCPAM